MAGIKTIFDGVDRRVPWPFSSRENPVQVSKQEAEVPGIGTLWDWECNNTFYPDQATCARECQARTDGKNCVLSCFVQWSTRTQSCGTAWKCTTCGEVPEFDLDYLNEHDDGEEGRIVDDGVDEHLTRDEDGEDGEDGEDDDDDDDDDAGDDGDGGDQEWRDWTGSARGWA